MKPRQALDDCRFALARGRLRKHRVTERGASGTLFVFVYDVRTLMNDTDGKLRYKTVEVLGRAFSAHTVRLLIDTGEARIEGDYVVRKQ